MNLWTAYCTSKNSRWKNTHWQKMKKKINTYVYILKTIPNDISIHRSSWMSSIGIENKDIKSNKKWSVSQGETQQNILQVHGHLTFWCNVKDTWCHIYCPHAVSSVMIAHVFKQLLSRYATTRYADHVYSRNNKMHNFSLLHVQQRPTSISLMTSKFLISKLIV